MQSQELLHNFDNTLSSFFVERNDEIHGMLISLLSRNHVMFLGPPGTAKSQLVYYFSKLLAPDITFFPWLLSPFSTPEEVFGAFSLKGLEQDRLTRNIKGKLACAHVAFLDEIWKCNSALLNSFLTILNEKKFFDDGKMLDIPLLLLVAASNELPGLDDNLGAMESRFVLRYIVKPIEEKSNFMKMLDIEELHDSPIFKLDDVYTMQKEVDQVKFDITGKDLLANIREALVKDGMFMADRTYKNCVRVLQAEAYFYGRNEVKEQDFDILQHVLWSDPKLKKKVYTTILSLSNPIKKRILEDFNIAEELYDEVMKLLNDSDKKHADKKVKDELTVKALETMTKLREIRKRLNDNKKLAKQAGQGIKDIEKIEQKLITFNEDVVRVIGSASGFDPA